MAPPQIFKSLNIAYRRFPASLVATFKTIAAAP
jgi:hypothetical protein